MMAARAWETAAVQKKTVYVSRPLGQWMSSTVLSVCLFDLGGEICIPGQETLTPDYVTRLEAELDKYNKELAPLKEFILPGGSQQAALCHVTRTVCRPSS
jgi:ATP:cob(I)alamin adenosyltransferase